MWLLNVANVEMLPIPNVASFQFGIGHWNWMLATMATFRVVAVKPIAHNGGI